MYARIEIRERLRARLICTQALECNIQYFTVVNQLLLQQIRGLVQYGIFKVGRRHAIDQQKQLGQTFNARLQLGP